MNASTKPKGFTIITVLISMSLISTLLLTALKISYLSVRTVQSSLTGSALVGVFSDVKIFLEIPNVCNEILKKVVDEKLTESGDALSKFCTV